MLRVGRTRKAFIVATVVAAVSGTVSHAAAPSSYSRPGHTDVVSRSSAGVQGNDDSNDAGVSRDGRYLVFSSRATNLVPQDLNQRYDVFWRDRLTGVTKLAELTSDGLQALGLFSVNGVPLQGDSKSPRVSSDGRYVAFSSDALNLVPGDTNLKADVFRHDMKTGQTVRISVGPGGVQANDASERVSMSADGRYIAFASWASNLVTGDTNGAMDVFVHDMKTGKTSRVSVSSAGLQGDAASGWPTITPNGRWLAFISSASNLVSPATTGDMVYRRDLVTGKTIAASVASDGSRPTFAVMPACEVGSATPATLPAPADGVADLLGAVSLCYPSSFFRSISDDGRYISFDSTATNLVPNDTNYSPVGSGSGRDSFVHDVLTGRTERVSVDSFGQQRSAGERPEISGNGRMVVYSVNSPDRRCSTLPDELPLLLATCSDRSLFTYDRISGEMQPISEAASGAPLTTNDSIIDNQPYGFSADGRFLAMSSTATNLAANDTNGKRDVFVRDRGPQGGVGGLAANGRLTAAGSLGFAQTGLFDSTGPGATLAPTLAHQGAELLKARAVYRPALDDLYLRLDLTDMPAVVGSAAAPGLLYGMRLTANGVRYEVRAQRTAGPDYDTFGGASFGLFRQDAATGQFLRVTALKGGYGTVGDAVVTAVPLSALGLQGGGRISDVSAFTALGSYVSGANTVLDSLQLR